jgi:hypothetical protein
LNKGKLDNKISDEKDNQVKIWIGEVWWAPIIVALIGLIGTIVTVIIENPSKAPKNIPTLTSIPSPTFFPRPTPLNCPPFTGPFDTVWGTISTTIGCPSSGPVYGLTAEENFQGGKMFWRESFDFSQAIVLFYDGTWEVIRHRPYDDENDPEFSCVDQDTPAMCPPTPKRGFGMLWCNLPELRENLGVATECERGYYGLTQYFEHGFMIRSDEGTVYVLYGREEGNWTRQ